jgi:hypothetical protein
LFGKARGPEAFSLEPLDVPLVPDDTATFKRSRKRRLTGLGFDTRVNGRVDAHAVITRWQGVRGYPTTGFLNTPQHQAVLTESVSAAQASLSNSDKSGDDRPARRRSRAGAHHHRSGGGGPGGLIGGVVVGLFGRR